jgi:hypothetical protein
MMLRKMDRAQYLILKICNRRAKHEQGMFLELYRDEEHVAGKIRDTFPPLPTTRGALHESRFRPSSFGEPTIAPEECALIATRVALGQFLGSQSKPYIQVEYEVFQRTGR